MQHPAYELPRRHKVSLSNPPQPSKGGSGCYEGQKWDENDLLRSMADDESLTVSDICKALCIGRTTFYRYVKAIQG
jgi:transcriptional regulator of acetoin/glycerol metabolism